MALDGLTSDRPWLRAAALAAVVVILSAVAVVLVPGSAHAATPPFEPDPNSIGTLTFFDASGNVVTGGTITDDPFAAYVQASAPGRVGDDKATLFGKLPKNGQAPGAFSGEALTASPDYPNASAPGPLGTSTLPVLTGSSGDLTLADLQSSFPNTDTSSDGYAGLYQLRLETSGPGQAVNAAAYDSADIMITGSTWVQVYPVPGTPTTTTTTTPSSSTTSTTTSSGSSTTSTTNASTTSTTAPSTGAATTVGLAVSPSDPVAVGTTVTLTATLSPTAAAGSVQFLDGAAALGGPVTVASGTATTTTTSLEVGTDALSAQFTPADPTAFAASISPTVSYNVTAATSTGTTTTVTDPSTIVTTASGALALTGANAGRTAGVGGFLLLAGSLIVLAERRRRRISSHRGGPTPPSPLSPPPSSPFEEPPCLS